MSKKETFITILCFVCSIFLFLCTIINAANGHIGAAIAGSGAGIFYLSFAFATYKKSQKGNETKP